MQSWLKLTKKTRLWGSVVWFARFISPDILYFSPCVNTSTLCTRFCINRTDDLRKNTLSVSFLISFYIFFSLYFYCFFFYLFLFFLAHTLYKYTHAHAYTRFVNRCRTQCRRFLQVTIWCSILYCLIHIHRSMYRTADSLCWIHGMMKLKHQIIYNTFIITQLKIIITINQEIL